MLVLQNIVMDMNNVMKVFFLLGICKERGGGNRQATSRSHRDMSVL